jgi:hypothetical protein
MVASQADYVSQIRILVNIIHIAFPLSFNHTFLFFFKDVRKENLERSSKSEHMKI